MEQQIFSFLVQWAGIILTLVLGVIVLISANGSGITKMEKALSDDDIPGHYMVKNSMSSLFIGLILLAVSCILCYVIGYLGLGSRGEGRQVLALVAELVISVAVSVAFMFLARKSLVERVLVNENEIIIHQMFGKPQNTSFDQIRTVKKKGAEKAVDSESLTLRPNGSRRFTVKKSMKNFNRFASQVDRDVKLPDLTKKRKKDVFEDEDDDI